MKNAIKYLGKTIAVLAVAGASFKAGTYISQNLPTSQKPQDITTRTVYFDRGEDDSYELVVRTFPDGSQSSRQIDPSVTKEDILREQHPTSLEEISFNQPLW